MGNWEIGKYVPVLISQFPKWCWAVWAGVFWEIGELGSMYLHSFPNFPNSAEPDGLKSFGKVGKQEIGKYVPALVSQFPNFPNSAEPDGLKSFGKLGNMYV